MLIFSADVSASHSKGCSGRKELLLVLEQDLLLVPFSMLHPKIDDDCLLSGEYLSEKFSLLVTPSLIKFKENQRLLFYFIFFIKIFYWEIFLLIRMLGFIH